MYINVQGLICHMHRGTSKTILCTVLNNTVATTGASTVKMWFRTVCRMVLGVPLMACSRAMATRQSLALSALWQLLLACVTSPKVSHFAVAVSSPVFLCV